MNRSSVWLIVTMVLILLVLVSGCDGIKITPDQQSVQSSVEAEVVEAVAIQTYDAAAKMTSEALEDDAEQEGTITETVAQTASLTVTETVTQTLDTTMTVTPAESATATVIAGPGDRAELVSINVAAGTVFNAGTSFSVTWVVKNVGTNTWTSDYDVVFVSGENLGAPTSMQLASVSTGQSVEISMDMVMPSSGSRFVGNWKLRNADGEFMLISNTDANSLAVDVKLPAATAVPYVSPTNTFVPTYTQTLTLIPTLTLLPSNTPTRTATLTPSSTATAVKSRTPTRTKTSSSSSSSVPAPSLISPSGTVSCTSTIRLSWSSVSPANGLGYYLWYYEYSSGGSDEGSTFSNYYDISGIYCGDTYTWRVQAVDKYGNVSPYSSSFQFVPQ